MNALVYILKRLENKIKFELQIDKIYRYQMSSTSFNVNATRNGKDNRNITHVKYKVNVVKRKRYILDVYQPP